MSLIASDFISLDGVVQAPGGPDEDTDDGFAHGGWSHPYFDVEAMGAAFDATTKTTEALLFGRRTWQAMAAAWPAQAGDPFADHMNSVLKYVVSNSLAADDLEWNNSHLLPGDDVAASVAALKTKVEGDIHILGSSQLVRYLVSHDLIDEFNLMIEPILLGGGKSIFPDDGVARGLELKDLTRASTGVLIARY
ncbi:MAG TPA: dihydrofolate reductase family protein, partial [Acidimicrobiia bacterium]